MNFDLNKCYAVSLKVTHQKIEARIDGNKMIDQDLAGHKISIRSDGSSPAWCAGFSSYRSDCM